MGFEYGYSLEREEALVLWEGQFGDFANGAQTVVDEFISSALQKWGERSSVVLLLPHGYEGQGPDHSSARIERYLQLCAEQNMTVAQPASPANYFHLLRWHMKNPARRPLIVFTPKSMLRLKAAGSALSDFTSGHFQPVIGDDSVQNASRVIFCSGKIYHDLVAERTKLGETGTAIVRVELLYPLPIDEMVAEANKHPNANLLWVQDEPAIHGHTLHCVHRMHMADMDLEIASCVAFLVVQRHLQQLEAITCTKMSRRHCCSKPLLANAFFDIENAQHQQFHCRVSNPSCVNQCFHHCRLEPNKFHHVTFAGA
jgi:2-oxoglutarate dehydrogenase E1 component